MARYGKARFLVLFLLTFSTGLYPEDLTHTGEIALHLGAGAQLPILGSVVLGNATQDFPFGLDLNRLVDNIFIEASAKERFFLSLDYDSLRGDFFSGGNIYNFLYTGKYYEPLQWVSLGNLHQSLEGTELAPILAGSSQSFALKARAKFDRLELNALARYDNVNKRDKTYIGRREFFDIRCFDTQFAANQYFHLPDRFFDNGSVYILSGASGGKILINGSAYQELQFERDYFIDDSKGWIFLQTPLADGDSLLVYYECGGTAAGSPGLGSNAIIDESGVRRDFNLNDFPEYYEEYEGRNFLKLHGADLNSFWELKNGYRLPGTSGAEQVLDVGIVVYDLFSGAVNEEYSSLGDNWYFYPRDGVIFLELSGGGGFNPRPLPGPAPFSEDGPSGNPFGPDNPVYGNDKNRDFTGAYQFVNFTYAVNIEEYFLGFAVIEDSIVVKVNGGALKKDDYEFDPYNGVVDIKPGKTTATSIINISWLEGQFGQEKSRLTGALTAGLPIKDGSLKALITGNIPLQDFGSPKLADIQSASGALGLLASWETASDDNRDTFKASAEAAMNMEAASFSERAIINGFESEKGYSVSLENSSWQLASPSTLLPEEAPLFAPEDRGDLLFKNYYDESFFKGTYLNTLDWPLPAENIFEYGQKCGPYNTADKQSGEGADSLVVDYYFKQGSSKPFVCAASNIDIPDLAGAARIVVDLKYRDVVGERPYIFLELLETYNEDLDEDGILDKEAAEESLGFKIIPAGGGQTTIGTNDWNKANGVIDSEDLNRNGKLDWAEREEGQIISPNMGVSWIYHCGTGTGEWTSVSFDISHLIAAGPELWENADILRLTVMSGADSLAADSSGKILINNISFETAPFINNAPLLSEVYLANDFMETASPLSQNYPVIYDNLYGAYNLRMKNGHSEQLLKVSLINDLANGAEISVSNSIYPKADFKQFNSLDFFLFIPSSSSLPPDSNFVCGINDTYGGLQEVLLPAGLFGTGWNHVSISFGGQILVNDIGTSLFLNAKSLSSVFAVSIGLRSGEAVIPAGSYFLLDEIYLWGPNPALSYGALASLSKHYAGSVFMTDDFSILGNIALDSRIRYNGKLSENYPGPQFVNGNLDLSSDIATYFPLAAGIVYNREWNDREDYLKDYQVFQQSIGFLVPDMEFLPELKLTYHGLDSSTTLEKKDEHRHSMTFDMTGSLGTLFSYNYRYLRSWDKSLSKENSAIKENHTANLNLKPKWGSFRLSAAWTDDYYSAGTELLDPWSSWLYCCGSLFSFTGWLPSDSELEKNSQNYSLISNITAKNGPGFAGNLTVRYNESILDETEKRNNIYELVRLGVPVSLADGALTISNSLERSVQADYSFLPNRAPAAGSLASALDGFLFSPFPNSTALSPPAARTDVLFRQQEFLSNMNIRDYAQLGLNLREPAWFLPSTFSCWFSQNGSFNGSRHSAKSAIGFTLNKRTNTSGSRGLSQTTFWQIRASAEEDFGKLDYNLKGDAVLSFQDRTPEIVNDLSINLNYLGVYHDPFMKTDPAFHDEFYQYYSGEQLANLQSEKLFVKNEISGNISYSLSWSQLPKQPPQVSGNELPDKLEERKSAYVMGDFVRVDHREKIAVSSYWLDGVNNQKEGVSRRPLIVTLEHSSILYQETFFNLELMLKLGGGCEERWSPEGFIPYPSIAFELGVTARFVF